MFNNEHSIPRAESAEAVGVSSAAVAAIIRDMEEKQIESHSMMIIRHGKVAFEAWRKPYGPDILHTMYSVSKSVTATAAGFAMAEGLLTPDTRLVDVFPEYANPKDDDLERITLHSLMTMTAGKNVSLLADKTSDTWVKDFMETKQSYSPGEGWSYISENTYCVAAMIARVTGMTVTEYLTPRLYEPLGITKTQWERDSHGTETGGWGLFLKTEDLAKIALCYLNGGKFGGKQIIPKGWCKLASANHTSGIPGSPEHGYGYFIWGCACGKGVYRFDGMFSQFAYIFPEEDAVVILTDNEINEDKARRCLEDHVDGLFFDGEAPEAKEIAEFPELEEIEPMSRQPETEKKVDGRTIKITPNPVLQALGFPLSVLTFPAIYMCADKAGPIDNVRFNFYEDECTMYWTEGDESNIVHIGLDGEARRSRIRLGKLNYTLSSSGTWVDENCFEIWLRPLEAIGQRRLKFTFKGDSVTVTPSCYPSLQYLAGELAPTLQSMIPGQAAYAMFKLMMLHSYKILDADQKAKLV